MHAAWTAVIGFGLAGAVVAQVPRFERVRVSTDYHSEGAAIGDFNRDGVRDLAAGAFWFEGPDFTRRHPIWSRKRWDPLVGYSNDSFFVFVEDFDGDAWDDVLVIGFPGTPAFWYRNPGTTRRAWRRHLVLAAVDMESPTFVDVDGDGARDLVCATGGQLGFASRTASPTASWTFQSITPLAPWTAFLHGLGVGDVDGDGRQDVITALGWFAQPSSGGGPWAFTQFLFGSGGAQMHAMDVDRDGDADIVTSLNAHGYGLAWFEQVAPGGAAPFVERRIMGGPDPSLPIFPFSQLHALASADFDGDGLLDVVTGKTFRAHNGTDPGASDPAVVFLFRQRRGAVPGFDSIKVDLTVGIGRQIGVGDLNGDGRPDIVVANKRGVHVLRQVR